MNNDIKNELLKKKKQKLETKLVAIRLPEDVFKELAKLAKETDESLSSVAIFALRKALGLANKKKK